MTRWIEAIQRTLRLSGDNGVLVHVDHAGPERLGELAHALLAEWPDLDVLDGVEGLETAPAGATRVLVPRVEEALWLNLNRPIVTRRRLKIVLWCDHATTVELSRNAPDFFDWISAHVECPAGYVPFALAGFRAAIQAKARGIHWTGDVDEAGRHRVAALLAACAAGTTLRWVHVEGPYEEVVRRVESVEGTGVWIGAAADAQWKMWRFRWACAEAKSRCSEIVLAPGLEGPGFWPIHDTLMPLTEACKRLSEARASRAGLCAALLGLEGEAVDLAGRLIRANVTEKEIVDYLVHVSDPGAALASWAKQSGRLIVTDMRGPMLARVEGRPPIWTEKGLAVERALQRGPEGRGWSKLAHLASDLGDDGARAAWTRRALLKHRRRSARDTRAGIPKGLSAQQSLGHLANELVAEGNKNGVSTQRFGALVVHFAKACLVAGLVRLSMSLLLKVVPAKVLEGSEIHPERVAADAWVVLDPDKSEHLGHLLTLFLAGPTPNLAPSTVTMAMHTLVDALQAEGRFGESTSIASSIRRMRYHRLPHMADVETEFHKRWLSMCEPIEGLVVSVPVLADAQTMEKHGPELQELLSQPGENGEPPLSDPASPSEGGRPRRRIRDLGAFFARLLQLDASLFDNGPALPQDLSLYLPEGHETLRPTLALRKRPSPGSNTPASDESTPASRAGTAYTLLVWDLPDAALDKADTREGAWAYPPAAKFDRLLRACRVPIGLLTNRTEVRLFYAPHGESSGVLTFHVGDMAQPGGREILDGLVLLLSAQRLFGVAPDRQLPALLAQSRERQANVTNTLADQVFEALEILLRGFAAAGERDGALGLADALARGGDEVYAGLLTVLLRLVFLLYAEDRGLLPTKHPLYAGHLSVLSLFDQLQADFGAFPDTMAHRFGAWARLLSLFRAVYFGLRYRDLVIPARRGQLFDPHEHPFLEGWGPAGSAPVDAADRASLKVPSIDDETVFLVLHKLLLLGGQRLSYRVLDVEQIGSVYEALMGYRVVRATGPAVCLKPYRVWVSAAAVLNEAPNRRAAFVEEQSGLPKAAAAKMGSLLEKARTEGEVIGALGAQRYAKVEPAKVDQFLIQPGSERRRTSSHYTPRSLSEPIVRKTLEPLLRAMGEAPPSEQILNLKVCDPAMGSGAFLVEACRFLADQVVAAWTREGEAGKIAARVDDIVNHARRLVAQRCLYGVDKNAFAVSLAKLSLWLVTLARDEPFTFVDHALRHGDSLVGLSLEQIKSFHWKPEKQLDFVFKEIAGALDEAVGLRQEILDLAGRADAPTEEKEKLLWDAEDALERVRLIGDLVVGAFFAAEKDKDREKERRRRLDIVERWLRDGEPQAPDELREMQAEIRGKTPVFHWMVEYPEVFWSGRPDPLEGGVVNENAWMDAFVGNPPFAGKNGISEAGGPCYLPWLQTIHEGAHGNADLCAHFFRRADALLGAHGTIGFIATNTIAQGDTRTVGLQQLIRQGSLIYDAVRDMRWGGDADVIVTTVHVAKGHVARSPTLVSRLDGKRVTIINSRLDSRPERPDPAALVANANNCYVGSYVLGIGFVLTPAERAQLIEKDPKNAERIFLYVGGEDLNSSPTQVSDRHVISFGTLTLEEAESWPDLVGILRERVKPERDRNNRSNYRDLWWQFAEYRPGLYGAISGLSRCLVTARVTKHLCFTFQPTTRVLNEKVYVFLLDRYSGFAAMQARTHELWARLLSADFGSSSIGAVLAYAGSDSFETFPFPQPDPRTPIPDLESIGQTLYEARAAYMVAHQVGLTVTYNRLKDPDNHDPEIEALRRLHEQMDRAVLAAYGWGDLPVPPYGTPVTDAEKKALERFEDEVIDRLFSLNAERAAAEKQAGAAASAKQKPRAKPPAAAPPGAPPPSGSPGSEARTPRTPGRKKTPPAPPKNTLQEQLPLLPPEDDDPS